MYKKTKNIYTILLIIYIFLLFISIKTSFAQCDKERWNVKTLIDPDTTEIDFGNIIQTTVSEQCALTRPATVKNKLRMKSESTVYELIGYVTDYKLENDRDYHVVIEDPETAETIVVEIVDPDCPDIDKTSRYETFRIVQEWFKLHFNPTTSFKTKRAKVKLTGVGFFDFLHGQRGMAPSGRGRPFTPINPANGTQIVSEYNSGRYPSYYSLDLRIDKRWNFKMWSLVTYADVQDITGRKNVVNYQWDKYNQVIKTNNSIGLLPTIGINAMF